MIESERQSTKKQTYKHTNIQKDKHTKREKSEGIDKYGKRDIKTDIHS